MRALYLIRHGETDWNAERRLQGREDIPLSRTGTHQAVSLRATLAAVLGADADGAVVVVSPLLRARQTCDLLGLEPSLVDDRWQEADLGTWTGRTREDLVAAGDGAYAAWRAGRHSPPGGEPLADLAARVEKAMVGLPEADHVVVVTHGGPIRAVCRRLLGLDPGHLVPVQPGSLTAIDTGGALPRLKYFNLTPLFAHELSAEPSD